MSSLIPVYAGAIQRTKPDLSQPHGLTVDDLTSFVRVGDPVASLDGKSVAFTVREVDAKDKATTSIHVMDVASGISRRITRAVGHSDSEPCWMPDHSTLLFLSDRAAGKQQVFAIRVDGGEAYLVYSCPVGIESFRVAASGKLLVFAAEVFPIAEGCSLEHTAAVAARVKDAAPVTSGLVYNRLMVRHWDRNFEGKRSHLFAVPLVLDNAGVTTVGSPVDLMQGLDQDAPARPFGGADGFTVSPDGSLVAYAAKIPADTTFAEAVHTAMNIYVVSVVDGVKSTKAINPTCRAGCVCPTFSPDGRRLAFLQQARAGYESGRQRVVVHDVGAVSCTTLTEDWDLSPGSLAWSLDGQTLMVTASRRGRNTLWGVDASSGERRLYCGEHFNGGAAAVQGGIIVGQDSLTKPKELYRISEDGTVKQLTDFNASRLANIRWGAVEEVWWPSPSGQQIHGWLVKPVGFEAGKQYPLAVLIHGGPQGAWEDHFHYRWNLQAFAAAGYGVFAANISGSTGFGQEFTDAVCGEWGGQPFDDLMSGVDYVLRENAQWLDAARVCALGASFGGYMINWINGHTDRFKCLVNHDGIFNTVSAYYTTEELWFMEWEMRGRPTDPDSVYQRWNPSLFVSNWRTPTLVVHSQKDYRLCDTEGLATFTALQRAQVASRYLWFPDENHWVSRAVNSRLWYDTVLQWLSEHV